VGWRPAETFCSDEPDEDELTTMNPATMNPTIRPDPTMTPTAAQ
jgi:hypothetical protein